MTNDELNAYMWDAGLLPAHNFQGNPNFWRPEQLEYPVRDPRFGLIPTSGRVNTRLIPGDVVPWLLTPEEEFRRQGNDRGA